MPEAGLKIAQKGLKNTFFCQNFAEAPSLARVFPILGGLNPPDPPTRMYEHNYTPIYLPTNITTYLLADLSKYLLTTYSHTYFPLTYLLTQLFLI